MSHKRRSRRSIAAALFALALPVLAQAPNNELAIAAANDRASDVRAMLAKGADPNA
jgi:hypothetical protein